MGTNTAGDCECRFSQFVACVESFNESCIRVLGCARNKGSLVDGRWFYGQRGRCQQDRETEAGT
jgi:hypothetical protein